MNQEILLLMATAASLAFIHTLFGPDHYLPFIVMSKARKWTIFKTIWVTTLCGLGHVGSSILIGAFGVAFGFGISKIEGLESIRGNIAAWAFILFGLIYFIWGMWRAIKNKPHKHIHNHANGDIHTHEHTHENKHDHIHKKNITPWVLFTIFVLGPCEPLIPILMYPAAKQSTIGLVLVVIVFSVITIATMLGVVLLASKGIKMIHFRKIEKYTHAIAGATIFLSGFAIIFLGL
ncbi:MAG: sulfite exporter TauE/SafE family protein [Bacteroidales bacterium]|nr:sulfite exporter TauE/SafE family protein [Bacteroidales bacterium]